MGYYTDYDIQVEGIVEDKQWTDVAKSLTEISAYEWDEGLEQYGIKWYSFNDDMITLSKEYPDLIFTLDGDGEESGDVWRRYYKGGKVQSDACRVEVIYDPFDESKLV